MIVAVIPAKDLPDAKMRLSPLLAPSDRRSLFCAMLEDVLTAVCTTSSIARVLVVTREPDLMRLARRFDAEVCREPTNRGHTQAVQFAIEELRARSPDAVLTIPGDVPLVTKEEIEAIVAASPRAPSVVLVPSRNGQGTNGVLLRPPDAMRLRFGEPSFVEHVQSAERHGLAKRVLDLPGLALDIDTSADLAKLRTQQGGASTRRLLDALAERGVFEKVSHHAN